MKKAFLVFVSVLSIQTWGAMTPVTIKGQITLPSLSNPRNLFQSKTLLKPASPGGSCSANTPYSYQALPQSSINMGVVFEVNVIPLNPKDFHRYPATVNADGSFSASVPATTYGYCVTANADKTHLTQCNTTILKSGSTVNFLVNFQSTLQARGALTNGGIVSPTVNFSPGLLSQLVTNLENTFSQRISGSVWAYMTATLLGLAGYSANPPTAKYYADADKVPYALYSSSDVLSPTILNFSGSTTVNLLTTTTYSSAVKFSASSGSSATITKQSAGYATVAGLKSGQSLELVFPNNNIRTVGLRIANGSGPGASTVRRAFRFRAYDRLGNQVGIPLNWYTYQPSSSETASFYGITVNSEDPTTLALECMRSDGSPAYCENPIYRLVISPSASVVSSQSTYNTLQSQGDPFYIDDIYISTQYTPMKNLGWISNGWQLTSSFSPQPNKDFNHYLTYRDNNTSPDPNSSCTWDNNFSGSNHWLAAYPSSTPSGWVQMTLMGPAFTLSNLPFNSTDTVNSNTWLAAPISVPRNTLWSKIVKTSATNSCSQQYNGTMDPNTPGSWNNPFAPVEWTFVNPRCVIAGTPTCTVSPWSSWGSGLPNAPSSSTMNDHWSHVHWQQHAAVESTADESMSALMDTSSTTKIYQQYSTDNGATWRTVYWNPDEDHRGRNGLWYHLHEHPYPDSDIQAYIDNYKKPWDPNPATPKQACQNTDFWKSGWKKTQSPYTNGVYNYDFLAKDFSGNWVVGSDGKGARDTGDTDWDGECRQWDTEFYQDYLGTASTQNADGCCRNATFLSSSAQSSCTQADANGCLMTSSGTACQCSDDPVVLGTTMRYRFVFTTNTSNSKVQCYRTDGVSIPCEGIRIDDVAFNNDSLEGYYTDFQSFYNPDLGSPQ